MIRTQIFPELTAETQYKALRTGARDWEPFNYATNCLNNFTGHFIVSFCCNPLFANNENIRFATVLLGDMSNAYWDKINLKTQDASQRSAMHFSRAKFHWGHCKSQ